MDLAQTFYTEWFAHPEWWFCSDTSKQQEIDNYLSTTYESLLDEAHLLQGVVQIIIWDQLPRHCYRNQYACHIIDFYLSMAVEASYAMISQELSLNMNEWAFALLPLRHTKLYNHIHVALTVAWKHLIECCGENEIAIMKRFLTATYKNMPSTTHLINIMVYNEGSQCSLNEFKDVLDEQSNTSSWPTITNYSVPSFLNQCMLPGNDDIVVSLSGGVDSMVCSWIMCMDPKMKCRLKGAVHINYKNRTDSDLEEAFVRAWCSYIGLHLCVRSIDEIQRRPCMDYDLREVYETYTRHVRFEAYEYALKYMGANAIMLGHNKDDCLENILTNICYGQKYDRLSGMLASSSVDGILFVRPLLNVDKHSIISFANDMRIPYLKNSTPVWSQRGKIRANVVPAMNAWDERLIPGLFKVERVMADFMKLIEDMVSIWVSNTYCIMTDRATVYMVSPQTRDLTTLNEVFWRSFFKKQLGPHNGTVSTRCIQKLILRLQDLNQNKKDGFNMHLKKNVIIEVVYQLEVLIKLTVVDFPRSSSSLIVGST